LLVASTREFRAVHYRLLASIVFVVACYGFVLHEQLVDHPWIASANPIWAKVSELLGDQVKPSVSVVRDEPFYAVGAPLANVLALLLGLIVGADRRRAHRALQILVWSGAAFAIYGIWTVLFDPTMLLWREKIYNTDKFTGTFVNPDHAAAYIGSCAVAALIVLMQTVRRELPQGPIIWEKFKDSVTSGALINKRVITQSVLFFICLIALFMTRSRAGILLSLFVIVVAVVVFFRRDLPRVSAPVAIATVGLMALGLFQLLGGSVEARIDEQGLFDQGRFATYQSTLRLIADHPWFGTGLGTFSAIFPAYRSGDISIVGVWNNAHSTPLELAAELGIPLALIIVGAWIVAVFVLLRGTRRSRHLTVAPLVAVSVCLIGLLHSSIDFPLQLPGYSIVVFALVGVGLAQSFETGSVPRHPRRRSKRLGGEVEGPEASPSAGVRQTEYRECSCVSKRGHDERPVRIVTQVRSWAQRREALGAVCYRAARRPQSITVA
jgi:hypothetical protein